MKNKIKKILQTSVNNSFISLVILLITLFGQSYAQWEETNLPSNYTVNALAICDSVILAGTDGDGIFVSTDNGENWASRNNGLQSKVIHSIFINETTIFAATETGASVSSDYGLNWNTINSGLSGQGVWSFAIGKDLFGVSILYAGTWSGIYSSSDNGTSWTTTGLYTTMPVHSIVTKESYVFAATLGGGVFKSLGGFGWNDISIIEEEEYSTQTELFPVYSLATIDTNIIASAGPGRFYYTSYYDTLFSRINTFISKGNPVLCFATRDGNLLAGNSIGNVYLAKYNGSLWSLISPSLKDHAVYSLTLNNLYIFAGTESGVWRLSYPISGSITDLNNFQETPTCFALEQNYPNPFNSSTKIKFTIPNGSRVILKVYNILGELVDEIIDKYLVPGTYEFYYSADNLQSGVYFYSLITNEFTNTKKLILLK